MSWSMWWSGMWRVIAFGVTVGAFALVATLWPLVAVCLMAVPLVVAILFVVPMEVGYSLARRKARGVLDE